MITLDGLHAIGAVDRDALKAAVLNGEIRRCRGVGESAYNEICHFLGIEAIAPKLTKVQAIKALRLSAKIHTGKANRMLRLVEKLLAQEPLDKFDQRVARVAIKAEIAEK